MVTSHSWRGVLRMLGKTATSSGTMRAVRRQADAWHIDYSHFTAQRRWSDAQLREAVSETSDWSEVIEQLGLVEVNSAYATARRHATR